MFLFLKWNTLSLEEKSISYQNNSSQPQMGFWVTKVSGISIRKQGWPVSPGLMSYHKTYQCAHPKRVAVLGNMFPNGNSVRA